MAVAPTRLPHVSPGAQRRIRAWLAILQRLSPALAARAGLVLFLTPFRRTLDPQDAPDAARAQLHSLEVDGETLRVYEWGHGPRTALIVHGWGSHAPRFAPLARALQQQGYRVVAFDAPAHGQSTGKRSSLPQFQAALAAVLARFGPAQLLVGHSLGALAVTLALGDTPAVRDRTLGAVLISMPSGVPYLIDRYQQMFNIRAATARRLRRRFERRFGQPPEHFVAQRVAGGLALPLLLVHDDTDDVVPLEHSTEFAAAVPDARLYRSQGFGHSGLLRDEATINVIAQFARELGHG